MYSTAHLKKIIYNALPKPLKTVLVTFVIMIYTLVDRSDLNLYNFMFQNEGMN